MEGDDIRAGKAIAKVAVGAAGGAAAAGPAGALAGAAVGGVVALLGEAFDFAFDPARWPGAREARRQLVFDCAAEAAALLDRQRAEQKGSDWEAPAGSAAALTLEELAYVVTQLLEQADRAVTDERARMLAAAMAGAARPDIDREMKSRVVRALLQLEPSDVDVLRRFARNSLPGVDDNRPASPSNWQALRAAGCIGTPLGVAPVDNPFDKQGPPVHRVSELEEMQLMTPTGHAVLAFLEGYRPEEKPPAT